MEDNEKTSAIHKRDDVSCIKGCYADKSFVKKKLCVANKDWRSDSQGRRQSKQKKCIKYYRFFEKFDQTKKKRRQIHMDDHDPFHESKQP